MIDRLKHIIRKLFLNSADEATVNIKKFTSKEADYESLSAEWHLPAEEAVEPALRQFSFLDSPFSGKGYQYLPPQENFHTSHLSPVVLAYTHIDDELLKDLGLSKPE